MSAIDVAKTLADLAVGEPTEFVRADAGYASRRQDARLLFERRLDPVSLMPLSLSAGEDAAVRAAAIAILGVLDHAADLYRQDPAVRAHFPAYRDAEPFLLADPGIRPTAGVFRLDGVLTEAGEFKMIEASTGGPGGVIKVGAELRLWAESIASLFNVDTPSYGNQPFGADHLMFLRFLIAAHRQQFGTEPEGAAIVGLGGEFANEVALMVDGFQRLGVPTRELDATELRRRTTGRGMLAGDFEVSLTYNKLDQVKLIRYPAARPYLEAMAHGEICMLPNLLAHCVLDDKSMLAFLTDPANSELFDTQQQEAIAKHIPWTRSVSAGRTTDPDGRAIDLPEFVLAHRERLVLKPNDRTRGEGVVIGGETTQQAWSAAVGQAVRGRYVVQEFVPLPEVDVPVVDGTSVEFRRLKHGLDAFVFGGEFAGYMCRASVDTIINVGKRGLMLPVTVEEQP
ncbi:hypothetical protein ACFV9C_41590 [Kribbella sp. NPDC059898]|uniref:hypothetical protein n=1 Tax=Kribbella sp. NPDC059898 TaxID=3346995 RepID=UPI00366A1CEA